MRYWIGLGANLGDRQATLQQAAAALSELGTIAMRSRIYSSAPVGGPPQPPYLNAALVLDTMLEPSQLLVTTQEIERKLGRVHGGARWGPRPIDVDLLLAGERGEVIVNQPGLELPHARLAVRAFALAPLCDLAPDLMHPIAQRPIAVLLREALRGELVAPLGDPL